MNPKEKTTLPESSIRKVAHGYTLGQILEIGDLQRRALKGETTIPMIEANNARAESIMDKFFREEFIGYKISKFETVHFHVIQEKRFFDPNTGERSSTAFVQTYPKETFAFMIKNGGFRGMITHILHDPK